jgi:hypothetical protein
LLEQSLIVFKNKVAKKTLQAKSKSIKNNLIFRITEKREKVKRLKSDLMVRIIKEAKKKTLTMKYKATLPAILNILKLAYT